MEPTRIEQLREALKRGYDKAKEENELAGIREIENPTVAVQTKATRARARFKAYQDALEMNDDDLMENFLAGKLIKK